MGPDAVADVVALRNAHDSGDEPPTPVRIPEPRRAPSLPSVDLLDGVAPRVVRVANGARITELHLLIADAVAALEHDQPELALQLLRQARADRMPTRGRRGGGKARDLGTP